MNKLLIFLFFCSVLLKSQVIKGTVLNENEMALKGVSVYVDGTAISTLTDDLGHFSLKLSSVQFGNLVFKKEGYETVIYAFNINNIKKLKVILSKESTIEEIKLLNYSDKNYERYINRFLNEFLGLDRQNIKIKNPKDIIFAYDKDNKTMKAKAKKTLIIENKNLGYILEYNLMSFAINDNLNLSTYTGTSFFKEMNGSKREKLDWQVNRMNAYYGSSMHFIRAAFHEKIQEEGFIINRIVQIPNPKYPTEEELKNLEKYRESLKKLPNNQKFLKTPEDILDIQTRKNRESKFTLALTEHKVPSEKFIYKSDGRIYLKFNDLLGIVYKKYPFTVEKNKIVKATIPINTSSMIDTDGVVFEISSDEIIPNPTK